MKKSFKSLFLCFCLLFGALLFVNTPAEAEAASYARTDRNTKVGKYYIWEDYTTKTLQISTSKTGDGTTLVHASSGRNICSGILSNGSTVYYLEGKYAGSSHIGYIYRIKTNGTGRTYIGKVNRASALTAYYDGNLYLDCDDKNDYMLIHTYRFNLKSKKATRVIKNLSVHNFYSKYFVGSPNRGDYGPNDLYSYNCKTKRKPKLQANPVVLQKQEVNYIMLNSLTKDTAQSIHSASAAAISQEAAKKQLLKLKLPVLAESLPHMFII